MADQAPVNTAPAAGLWADGAAQATGPHSASRVRHWHEQRRARTQTPQRLLRNGAAHGVG